MPCSFFNIKKQLIQAHSYRYKTPNIRKSIKGSNERYINIIIVVIIIKNYRYVFR